MKRKTFYSMFEYKGVTGVKKREGYEISAYGMKFNAYKSTEGIVHIVEPKTGLSIFKKDCYDETRETNDFVGTYEYIIAAKEEFEKRNLEARILELMKTEEYQTLTRIFEAYKKGKRLEEKLKK